MATNRQQCKFDSLLWPTLLPYTFNFVAVEFVADTVDFVAIDFIADTVNFVASVYGPKQHGRLCQLSTKLIVLNSTLLPVCTALQATTSTNNSVTEPHNDDDDDETDDGDETTQWMRDDLPRSDFRCRASGQRRARVPLTA